MSNCLRYHHTVYMSMSIIEDIIHTEDLCCAEIDETIVGFVANIKVTFNGYFMWCDRLQRPLLASNRSK